MRAISAREFNQDTAGAKRDALAEPVFILDRGQPSHVLMSITHYKALLGSNANIVDLLGMPGIEDLPFDLPPKSRELSRPAEFD
ncbi:MAG: Prevent-host-death protein [Hydrocarboniphaga sp.]|uniref:type II toxin-antitoxin system Phd/YefM family antitoxin n=1 Tax=Hydrocarboniphaga sp. TaxID=2033016 RepID=UPI002631F2EA|nr:type II toxin-antitoxin system Phd/YefM family antitoxin [Hydrocarboniphaga sp.]MDB5972796.1 Prevent-host-death protein [Hydrocarboniphaga sp.]